MCVEVTKSCTVPMKIIVRRGSGCLVARVGVWGSGFGDWDVGCRVWRGVCSRDGELPPEPSLPPGASRLIGAGSGLARGEEGREGGSPRQGAVQKELTGIRKFDPYVMGKLRSGGFRVWRTWCLLFVLIRQLASVFLFFVAFVFFFGGRAVWSPSLWFRV